jgi:hypothetical protein
MPPFAKRQSDGSGRFFVCLPLDDYYSDLQPSANYPVAGGAGILPA